MYVTTPHDDFKLRELQTCANKMKKKLKDIKPI